MSGYNAGRDALMYVHVEHFAEPFFFEDNAGEFTIEWQGIYTEKFQAIDSITQQEIISQGPVMWVRLPTPVPIAQNTRLKFKEKTYRIESIHNDHDDSCANLFLYRFGSGD